MKESVGQVSESDTNSESLLKKLDAVTDKYHQLNGRLTAIMAGGAVAVVLLGGYAYFSLPNIGERIDEIAKAYLSNRMEPFVASAQTQLDAIVGLKESANGSAEAAVGDARLVRQASSESMELLAQVKSEIQVNIGRFAAEVFPDFKSSDEYPVSYNVTRDGVVMLSGIVTNKDGEGNLPIDRAIMKLPPELSPAYAGFYSVSCDGNICMLVVNSRGEVTVNSVHGDSRDWNWLSIDGAVFLSSDASRAWTYAVGKSQ